MDELLTLCDELAANLDTVTATRRRLLEAALQEALAAAQTDNRGALAQQLLGAGRHLSPARDAVAERTAED